MKPHHPVKNVMKPRHLWQVEATGLHLTGEALDISASPSEYYAP